MARELHDEWRPSARKEVRKLDPPIRRRILAAIDALANDPHPPEATSITAAPGVFRIRVGDFRVLYESGHDRMVVLVIRIGTAGTSTGTSRAQPPYSHSRA